MLLLENLRFHAEEEANDPAFSEKLAKLCDVYVNDAFGSAHRAHASTVGMIAYVKQAAAGLLMDKELQYLTLVTQNPERPCVAILGGAKVSDKIEVIENLAKVVDKVLIGGAMAYTFLKSQGHAIGKSMVEDDKLDLAKSLLAQFGTKLVLPVDHVVAAEFKEGAENENVVEIPADKMALDIGSKTVALYEGIIRCAKTIIWNGPMGVFEKPPFDKGTMALAHAVADIRRGVSSRRRRFREGDQDRWPDRQDLACFHRRRSFTGIPVGTGFAWRGGSDREVAQKCFRPHAAHQFPCRDKNHMSCQEPCNPEDGVAISLIKLNYIVTNHRLKAMALVTGYKPCSGQRPARWSPHQAGFKK